MGFSSKRGRPRKSVSISDKGTSQLQAKRLNNATVEPFDLLQAKSLISDDQHRAGIHLRWLFTIKNGAPNISAMVYDDYAGRNIRADEEDWRLQREAEYNAAIEALRQNSCLKQVMDAAVYNVIKLPIQAENLDKLRDGLRLLCKLWKRSER